MGVLDLVAGFGLTGQDVGIRIRSVRERLQGRSCGPAGEADVCARSKLRHKCASNECATASEGAQPFPAV